MIPETLRTERLLLRGWRDEDVGALAEIYAQPEYVEHNERHGPHGARCHVLGFARAWREEGFSLWAAEELESGRLVGRIGLIRHHDWPLAPDPVEVGWALHRDWWGRGLATEGGRAAIACWRRNLADRRLLSITRPGNARSRAVMERLGLTYRGDARWRGRDVVWYAVDREP
ncbi:MAG TPA: GNAT family N-acetyltransferase [Gaiellaceae bacterium]|nr:GNAT family N-acetyltransferase [Gaiellaceae bacterium]